MANRRMEFMIGLTVIVVFATIVIMTILFGSNQTSLFHFGQGQKMSILFDKAPGIKNTSRITKSGIEIGRVFRTDLLDSEDGSQVRVYFTLNDPKTRIFSNEQARIKPSLLMGEAEIEFVKNPRYVGDIREITPNDTIVGTSGSDIMGTVSNIEGDLKAAIHSINSTAEEASRFIGNLNTLMGTKPEIDMKKENLNKIFNELDETLKTTRSLATNMDSILSDPQVRENIQRGSRDFPEILNKVNALLDNGDDLFQSFKRAVARSHTTFDKLDRSLDNVQDFTQVLSDDGQEFISNMNASSQDITKMVRNISTLSEDIIKQIDNKDTPLGMMTDENIGHQVRGIVRNVESATEKVQPILDDARIFTNKIAHRPSSLIFSRNTYKGTPALGGSGYSYQPYSPAGGMSSRLWNETASRYPDRSPVSGGGHEYHPGSLESFRATYPETYSALQQQKPFGSCLSGNCPLGKPFFDRKSEEVAPQAGYVSDPGVYYGFGGAVPTDGDVYANGYYSETMPVSNENAIDVPRGGFCGMSFSLTKAFRKIFKGNEGKAATADCPLKAAMTPLPTGVPMVGSPYQVANLNGADGLVAENISWAPSYGSDDVALFNGSCDIPSCDTPQCNTPLCDSNGSTIPEHGGAGNLSQPLPVRGSLSPMESPLPELPTDKSTVEKPSTLPAEQAEELPPSAIRSGTSSSSPDGYLSSGVAPGYSNAAPAIGLPAPVKSRKRDFIDDGLPLRFSPND